MQLSNPIQQLILPIFQWCGSFSQIKQVKSLRLALNGGYVICFTNFRIKHNREAEILTGLKGQNHRLSDRKGQVYSYLIKNKASKRVLTISQFRRRKINSILELSAVRLNEWTSLYARVKFWNCSRRQNCHKTISSNTSFVLPRKY